MPGELTALILTYNEAPNIARTLEKLSWASEIVVVDSHSTDETVLLASAFPRVRVVQRKFDQHSVQWNFGVEQCRTEWILALDADHVLSEQLAAELQVWKPDGCAAYNARFTYCVGGRALRASLYPPRPVLFQRSCCQFTQDGHTQKLAVEGPTGALAGPILHDDRKALSRWLQDQERYASLEARKLLSTPPEQLTRPDRLRRMIAPAPFLVFLYTLAAAGFDGWPGWCYVLQRTTAELLLSLKLLEEKLDGSRES